MNIPAIIFINTDTGSDVLNQTTQDTLNTQLFIDDIITGEEFDARVLADPNYPTIIHLQGLRVLVIRNDYDIINNKELADVVLFFKYGLASILKNECGPVGLTLPIARLYLEELLRYNNSIYTVNLPAESNEHCHKKKLFGIAIYGLDASGVHCPNPDNELHNEAFKHRK